MTKVKKPVEVFTDGSLMGQGEDAKGGYGIVMLFGSKIQKYNSSSYRKTATIIRMELKALIKALEMIKPGFDIYMYCDSKLIVDTINRRLVEWVEFGSLDSKKHPELWRRFMRAKRIHIEGGSFVHISWIRSHAGNKYNEMADKLAQKGVFSKNKVECKDNN